MTLQCGNHREGPLSIVSISALRFRSELGPLALWRPWGKELQGQMQVSVDPDNPGHTPCSRDFNSISRGAGTSCVRFGRFSHPARLTENRGDKGKSRLLLAV